MAIGFGISSRNWWRAQGGGGGVSDDRFIFTVKTDNAGTSASDQFTIPTSTTGVATPFNYDIETSDGQTITGLTGNHTITFPSAGEYEVRISGSFPYMFFNNGGDKLKILDIKNFGIYALGSTNQISAFRGCSNMTIIATDSGNFGSVTIFSFAWFNCRSLTSFPLIDTSSGTNFRDTWRSCISLTSFPLLDTSSGTNFYSAWRSCTSLASFPSNAFDSNIATNYNLSFTDTNLTTQSIDDILVSLDTSGVSNGIFTQSGGQAPSATGEAAIDSLVGKGWTVTVTGGYTPPQLLLDEYPNAAAAYSLRELSTAFVGQPVVRVRRSSDNAEQDFTATEITDGTLTTFTGANDGFVTTWYDQSGNNKHATQSTALYQRILVTNGVLNTFNGKPCDDYVTSSRAYNVPNDAYSAPFTYFMVAKPNAGGSDVYSGRNNNGTSILEVNFTRFYGGNFVDVVHNLGLDQIVTYALFNGVSSEFQVNDITPITTGDIGTSTNVSANNFGFAGYYNNSSQVFTGKFQEMIIYTSNKSTYREGVIANINNHYSIY